MTVSDSIWRPSVAYLRNIALKYGEFVNFAQTAWKCVTLSDWRFSRVCFFFLNFFLNFNNAITFRSRLIKLYRCRFVIFAFILSFVEKSQYKFRWINCLFWKQKDFNEKICGWLENTFRATYDFKVWLVIYKLYFF